MAEEISTQEPDLTSLQNDLDISLSTNPSFGDDRLLAKPEAIDIYKNVVGNPVEGSNPQMKQANVSTLDFAKSLGDASLKETSTQEDPYIKMRPFTYSGDYDAANFDRYYGTKAYKTLGFSPYRDNDALYNQKMTFGDQFVRAASQWDNLMVTGFMSGIKTWGTIFTDPLAPDLDSARDMKRSMAVGNISTGGAGGFIGNTFLNSAYSIGIGLEFLAEEAALAAATVFTGGMAGEVTLPAMAARGGFLGRQLGKIGELGAKVGGATNKFTDAARMAEKAGAFGKTAAKTAGGIDDMGSARQFFGKVAGGAFDLVNPLESTVTALKSTRYANDLAKTVGTAGAFMDDIIRIKTAASEAKLEGGMVKIDANERLIDQYREMHGKDPEGDDLKEIEDLSSIEARRTTLYNFPAIMSTNKLLFSTILYPLSKTVGTASTRVLQDLVAEGGMKALAKDPFKVIGSTTGAQLKAAAKSFTKPKLYGTYGMTYLKANVAEGLQENIQEAISQGAINHALAVQKDPGMAAYRGYMGYLMDGLKDQVSAQGAETFASGFLMGMFTQPIMTAPAWAASKGIEKIKNKEAREEAKKQRDEALAKQQSTLNDMANNDINYWAPDIATAVKNGALSSDLTEATSVGDEKSARDAKFRLEFNHIETAITSGKFEDLMTKLADYKNLTPEEALEAFSRYGIGINTKEDAVTALNQMDGVIERARSIKDKYERVAQDYPNPYNLSGLKPGTTDFNAMADAHMAWREAQKNLVFATSEFQNYSARLESMTNDFSSLASGIAKADAQSLLSTMSMPGLAREIVTLKQELKSLNELEGTGAVKREKTKSLDLLENFQEAIKAAQETIAKEDITSYLEKQVIYQDAKEAYQKYLGHVAKKNESILFNTTADKAFGLLTDTLEMREEQQLLAKSINVLNNPKGFLTLQKRLHDAFGSERAQKDQRIAENLMTFMTMKDENNIIQELGRLGVKVPEDFLADYKKALNAKQPLPAPDHFIDPSTQSFVTEETDPAKFAQALELWDAFRAWMELNHNIGETEVPVETTEADKKAIEDFNAFKPELRESINLLYNKARQEGKIKDDVSLGTFMNTDKEAIVEIKNFESAEKRAAADEAKAAQAGIPLGTKVNDETRAQLNTMGYTNTQIDSLSREARETILTEGIPAEEYYKPAEPLDKKADIEKRRQAELFLSQNKLYLDVDLGENPTEELLKKQKEIDTLNKLVHKKRDEVNAKYDAELAALDEQPEVKEPEVVAVEVPGENPVGVALPTEQPRPNINPAYEGKMIFVTPGSGKTKLAKNNEEVVDSDQLLLEVIAEIAPDFPISENMSAGQNIYDAIKYGGVNKAQLYQIALGKVKAMTAKGKTVVTSSIELMKHADHVMVQMNEDLILDNYNQMKEIDEINRLTDIDLIAITEDIGSAIKKTPAELSGHSAAEPTENTQTPEVTIDDLNKNLTVDNLAIAQERGYDAIYKNNRYAITKVEQNSVTLKALNGSTVTAEPSEITAVTAKEDVVATPEDTNEFKGNEKVLGTGEFDVDFDADDLGKAANDITDNIC